MGWAKGQVLYGDRYVIERVLKQGGFGITYLASNQQKQPVVIKTLKDDFLNDLEYGELKDRLLRDFEREATRLAICTHPHIVQIENVFFEGELPCIAMEYVEGEDLKQRVKERGVLPESEALLYMQQIGEALMVVHSKGLLHRDLKPHNIVVRTRQREAVLLDFGIAREFVSGITQTHSIYATHGFAPKEQYDQRSKRGEYTDVYGLAATLYFLLTGLVPPPAFTRVFEDTLVPPKIENRRIGEQVNQAILSGMAIEPSDRPQSVGEWLGLLIGTSAAPRSTPQRQVRPRSQPQSTRNKPQKSKLGRRVTQKSAGGGSSRFGLAHIACVNLLIYPVIGWLLAHYAAPDWIVTLSLVGAATNAIASISTSKTIGCLTFLTWFSSVFLAGIWAVCSVYLTTATEVGIIAGAVASLAAIAVVGTIALLCFFLLLWSAFGKSLKLNQKVYLCLILSGTAWFGLILGWLWEMSR